LRASVLNFISVGGDGIRLIHEALKKTKRHDGDKLIVAMKGALWGSTRGPISIVPETRDIVQDIYTQDIYTQG